MTNPTSSPPSAPIKEVETATLKAYEKISALLQSHGQTTATPFQKAFELVYSTGTTSEPPPASTEGLPVAVLLIEELGVIDPTTLTAALLYKAVDDTPASKAAIEKTFGKEVATIVWGVKEAQKVSNEEKPLSKEAVARLFRCFAQEKRVVLLQLADRLNNLKYLASIPPKAQLRLASESKDVYAPIANRLGYTDIKATFEDFYLKCQDPAAYFLIAKQLKKKKKERVEAILAFNGKVEKALKAIGLHFRLETRTKSIYSIYHKIKDRNTPLEQIYDLIALRVILSCPEAAENQQCWQAYHAITNIYKANTLRTRAWIKVTRPNGYQSLHLTLMGEDSGWVEVQIRSERMHQIASSGPAAHWKYKEDDHLYNISAFDNWLRKVRTFVEENCVPHTQIFESSHQNLYSNEIAVFDEKGDVAILPKGASVLDFAIERLGEKGLYCTHAFVQGEPLPIQHPLKHQDKVSLILNETQTPSESWLHFLLLPKAKNILTTFLQKRRTKDTDAGKKLIGTLLKKEGLTSSPLVVDQLKETFKTSTVEELYCLAGSSALPPDDLRACVQQIKRRKAHPELPSLRSKVFQVSYHPTGTPLYAIQNCCKPVVGEELFAFITPCEKVHIHSKDCPQTDLLAARYPNRIGKAQWQNNKEPVEVTIGIKASETIKTNQQLTHLLATYDTRFLLFSYNYLEEKIDGTVCVVVDHFTELTNLIQTLQGAPGVEKVYRVRGL